jgi:hypothetical protein
MPEFIIKTYAPRGAPGLPTQCIGEAAVAADRASESADSRSAPCAGPAAAPVRPAAPAVPGRPGPALSVRPQLRRTEDRWQRTEDMRAAMCHARTAAVWADALFVSVLQRSDKPDAGQVRQAVAAAVRAYGDQGVRPAGRAGVRRSPRDRGRADALGSCGSQHDAELAARARAG